MHSGIYSCLTPCITPWDFGEGLHNNVKSLLHLFLNTKEWTLFLCNEKYMKIHLVPWAISIENIKKKWIGRNVAQIIHQNRVISHHTSQNVPTTNIRKTTAFPVLVAFICFLIFHGYFNTKLVYIHYIVLTCDTWKSFLPGYYFLSL